MNVLLSTAYWPNLHYFFYVFNAELITIEKHEHYQKQSFRNRTQILSANGVLNLSIPTINNNNKLITEVEICYKEHWQKNHWRAITSAYKNSPYFEFFEDDIKPFYVNQYKNLFDFNLQQLQTILKILKQTKEINFSSEYNPSIENSKDLRFLIHPKEDFTKDKTTLYYLERKYYQTFENKFNFTQNLSILDLLFNVGLQSLELLKK